ncbi:hypothetical protein RUM44_010621, partial [Polyplax serrata]
MVFELALSEATEKDDECEKGSDKVKNGILLTLMLRKKHDYSLTRRILAKLEGKWATDETEAKKLRNKKVENKKERNKAIRNEKQ